MEEWCCVFINKSATPTNTCNRQTPSEGSAQLRPACLHVALRFFEILQAQSAPTMRRTWTRTPLRVPSSAAGSCAPNYLVCPGEIVCVTSPTVATRNNLLMKRYISINPEPSVLRSPQELSERGMWILSLSVLIYTSANHCYQITRSVGKNSSKSWRKEGTCEWRKKLKLTAHRWQIGTL